MAAHHSVASGPHNKCNIYIDMLLGDRRNLLSVCNINSWAHSDYYLAE